ncbi:hypothetical protein GCM10020220_094410 [Nonomuraea rubra]
MLAMARAVGPLSELRAAQDNNFRGLPFSHTLAYLDVSRERATFAGTPSSYPARE